MSNLDLIAVRRSEVLKIIEEARKALSAAEAEMQELDIAGRTLARLSGGTWPPAGQENSAPQTQADSNGSLRPSMSVTKMIVGAMEQRADYINMMDGITPKEVRQAISEIYATDAKGEYVSTQMWRLAQRGDLVAIGDGRYRLAGGAR